MVGLLRISSPPLSTGGFLIWCVGHDGSQVSFDCTLLSWVCSFLCFTEWDCLFSFSLYGIQTDLFCSTGSTAVGFDKRDCAIKKCRLSTQHWIGLGFQYLLSKHHTHQGFRNILKGEESSKNQRIGRSAVKYCLLTMTLTNSQHLWLSAQDLHKTKPAKILVLTC